MVRVWLQSFYLQEKTQPAKIYLTGVVVVKLFVALARIIISNKLFFPSSLLSFLSFACFSFGLLQLECSKKTLSDQSNERERERIMREL